MAVSITSPPPGAADATLFDVLDWPALPQRNDPAWHRALHGPIDWNMRMAAVHEAGHVIANASIGRRNLAAHMYYDRGGVEAGVDRTLDPVDSPLEATAELAGLAVECAHGNCALWPWGFIDFHRAWSCAEREVGAARADEAVQRAWIQMRRFVARPSVAAAIADIASALWAHKIIDADRIEAVLRPHLPRLARLHPPNWSEPQWEAHHSRHILWRHPWNRRWAPPTPPAPW